LELLLLLLLLLRLGVLAAAAALTGPAKHWEVAAQSSPIHLG